MCVILKKIYLNSYGDRAVVDKDRYYLQRDSSGNKSYRYYDIIHNGKKTVFKEFKAPELNFGIAEMIDEFEKVQNSILRYYSEYDALKGR